MPRLQKHTHDSLGADSVLENFVGVSTWEECQSLCGENAECNAWSWNNVGHNVDHNVDREDEATAPHSCRLGVGLGVGGAEISDDAEVGEVTDIACSEGVCMDCEASGAFFLITTLGAFDFEAVSFRRPQTVPRL